MAEFTVMSSNICCWGKGDYTIPNRMPRVKEIYAKYLPDIIGTQETTLVWKKYLQENFPQYEFVGEPREDIEDPEHCIIMVKKNRFEVIKTETLPLSESGEFGSLGWDEQYPRIYTYAVLKDRQGGKEFVMMNSHLALTDLARGKMLEMIFKKIGELKMPAVFTGDFNTTMDSPAYKACIEGPFEDSREIAKQSETGYTFHGFLGQYPFDDKSPIDYCLCTKGDFEAKSYKIIKETVGGFAISDHYPVLTELELK